MNKAERAVARSYFNPPATRDAMPPELMVGADGYRDFAEWNREEQPRKINREEARKLCDVIT